MRINSWKWGSVSSLAVLAFLTSPGETEAGADDWKLGELTGDNVNVREAPVVRSGNEVGQLSTGDEVFITGSEGNWKAIIHEEQEAYIHGDFISEIERTRVDDGISIEVNGEILDLDDGQPFSDRVPGGRRVYVPFRFINEAFGTEVEWDADNYFVHVQDGDLDIRLEMFTRETFVNDEFVFLDGRPKLVTYRDEHDETATRTMIPIRFFSEILEADVEWDYDEQRVSVTRQEIEGSEEERDLEDAPTEESDLADEDTPAIEEEPVDEDLSEDDIEAASITGEVDVLYTLNMREGSSVSYDVIDKLEDGVIVEVLDFDGHWAEVRTADDTEGFVSSRFLSLEEDGEPFHELSLLEADQYADRTVLEFAKRGSAIDLSFEEEQNAFQISGNDLILSDMDDVSVQGLMSMIETDSEILVDVSPDYHYVIRESADRLQIDLLPPGLEGKRIFLDAGHGDHDAGGQGHGLKEKDIVLDVSHYAEALLTAAGAEVIMPRDDDTFISLDDRFRMANDQEADIFVSVHANAAGSPSAHGSETFWHPRYSPYGSERIARLMQDAMLDHLGTYDRGVFGHRGFRVIANSIMPSTLIELGFLTNPDDAAKLRQDRYRHKSADAILDALEHYYR